MYEVVHSHRTRDWLVLESASVSYGKATPYFPVIDLLKRYAHVEEHDDTRTVRARVTGQVLTLDERLQDAIPALLALLEALPDDSPFRHLDPPQRRQRTLEALKRLLLRESQVQPLLLVFEDLHWIDAETQALLDTLVDSLPTARLVLLVNYRPEYQHGWGSKTSYTQLRLDPLPPASADAFLQALLGNDPGLAPLKQLLIARTAGNPFFLEETVRTLVETEVLVGAPGAYRVARDLPTIQVPATVQAVLAARIDRLPLETKHLLQTAAVIGHEVPLALLQTIADCSEEALHRSLTQLQGTEFLYETRLFPEREYTFKHALTHEVAYSTLLQERRRVLHARIVVALEELYADRLAEEVDRLAHHALRGEVWDKAEAACRQAGARAIAHSAYREAVTYFEQALSALQRLPERPDTQAQAIDLRLNLRSALWPLGEIERIFVCLQEAQTLAEALGDRHRLGWVSAYLLSILCRQANRTTPSRLVSAPWRLPQIWGMLASRSRRRTTWGRSTAAWGTIVGRWSASKRTWRVSTASYSMSASACPVWPLCSPVVSSPATLPSAAPSLRGGLPRRKGGGLPRLPTTPTARSWRIGPLAFGICAKGTSTRPSLCSNAPSTSRRGHTSGSQSPGSPRPWERPMHSLDRPLRPCRCWSRRSSRASRGVCCSTMHSGWPGSARRICWLAVWKRRTPRHSAPWSSPVPTRNGAMKPTPYGSSASSTRADPSEVEPAATHYRHALVLAEELGMRPLQAHCHLGLGTLYTRTGQREQARAELSMAIALYRAMDMHFWLPQAEAALAQPDGAGSV